MRIATVAGIGLMIAGVLVLLFGGTFTSRRNVLEVGGLTVSAEEQRPIAPWVAGTALLAGVVLVVSGARRKA